MASMNDPLLPSYKYTDEKSSPRSSSDSSDYDSTPLRLGGGDSAFTRVKKHVNGLSKAKKVLALSAIALLGLHLAGHGFKGHHHRRGCHGSVFEEEMEEPVITSAEYASVINLPASDLLSKEDLYTANATFPIDLSKALSLDFLKVQGRVLVSRSDFMTEVPEASLVIESIWSGEDGLADVQMASGKWDDALSIASTNSETYHTVHVILPPLLKSLPSLHLTSSSALVVDIHPSATDLTFDSFSLKTETGDINFTNMVGDHVEVETVSGSVSGTYNVSKVLILKSITGDIKAEISVLPLFGYHPHHNGTHGHHGHNGTHGHGPSHGHRHHGPPQKDDGPEENDIELLSSFWPLGSVVKRDQAAREDGSVENSNDGEDNAEGDEDKPENMDMDIAEDENHHGHPHGRPGKPHGKPPGHPHGPHPPPHHPHGPPHRPHHGPKHGPHRGPEHGPHHGPPKPAFIGAFSSTGNISLIIAHQPPFVSSIIKAETHVGSVDVKHAKSFKGLFKAGTHVGNITVTTGGPKEIKVFKEVVGGTGGFVVGAVKFPHNHTEHGKPEVVDADGKDSETTEIEDVQGIESDDNNAKGGWKWPKFPGLPSGEEGPEGPERKRPDGPRRGPGGPHRGPGGPHRGPPGPPRGPGGPHKGPGGPHHRGPRPGFSKVEARTDVGQVTLQL